MASPQKENGYTPIANELLEALAKTKLTDGERRVLVIVLRKTYGWNKKEDGISLTQFQQETGLPRSNICRSAKSLVARMILGSRQNGTSKSTTYWVLKDYNKWIASPILGTSRQNGTRASPIPVKKVVAGIGHTKDNTKDIIKDNTTTTLEQVTTLLGFFNNILKNKAELYLKRVALKNKSGVISDGRKITLLNELINARERAADDNIFGYAVDESIGRDACNIGYINAIIKNKKTQKPSEYREYHAPAKLS